MNERDDCLNQRLALAHLIPIGSDEDRSQKDTLLYVLCTPQDLLFYSSQPVNDESWECRQKWSGWLLKYQLMIKLI